MYSKIVVAALLLVTAQALPLEQYHQASSFAAFNTHHNTIQHVHSDSVGIQVHSTPVHVLPVAQKALEAAQSYATLSFGHGSAPARKISAPIAVHATPVVVQSAHHEEEKYAPAKYEFAYGVEDHHTGDIHSHKETRDGDHTQGEYSLHEADGTIRTVKYTVDKHSGFNAVVERSGHAVHAQPAPHH